MIPALFFLQFIFFFHALQGRPESEKIKLAPFISGFQKPVHAVFSKQNPGTFYVVEQKGRIIRVSGGVRSTFLDISGFISSGYELGLLSMALPKSWKEAKGDVFYINYTTPSPYHTVIAEVPLQLDAAGQKKANFSKKRILLTFAQPYSNHNGGMMLFGPDGYLYIATGDGGSAGDPGNYAQNPSSFLGKILKIHPAKSSRKNYTIPPDAPVISGALPEIYAMGLRNPWRFSFDRKTGFLYAGDVGQNRVEEIDKIEKGGNYGWNLMEGNLCYKKKKCNPSEWIPPIHTYGRNDGISVTGGYVYRGAKMPFLQGSYLFSDYGSGNLWALPLDDAGKKKGNVKLLMKKTGNISSFSEDPEGELYIIDYGAGKILKILPE